MEKNKNIWVLLRSHVSSLPPVMSVIQCLLSSEKYNVKLISTQRSGLEHSNLIEYIIDQEHNSKKTKKLMNYISYRNYANKVTLKHSSQGDLFWIASLDTALCCLNLSFIKTNPYILQLHELYDTYPRKLSLVKTVAQKAKAVVVPEENRAGILQVWLGLEKRPYVFPNKPYIHPRDKKSIPTTTLTKEIIEKHYTSKPIILYQGHIGEDRNLLPVAEAIKELPEFDFWLLGFDHGFAEKLTSISKNIKYLGNVSPPHHLEITSYATIGIMSYNLINLNNLYCAPNKVWEYSGFGIPYLSNNCLSLQQLSNSKIGVSCEWHSPYVKEAILKIMDNYNIYQSKSKQFYDSSDLSEILTSILN